MTFAPTDNINYNDITGTVDVNVLKANPIVDTWPTGTDLTYGDELSLSTLSGGNADVDGTFSFDTPTETPDAGIYTADVTFAPTDNSNYNDIIGTVDVLVNKADQTINWTQELNVFYGATETLVADATSGLDVVFESDNTDVAVITGNQIEIIGYGIATITAKQDGDDNYNPAEDVEKIIDISVDIPENYNAKNINIYPVPTKDYLYIENNNFANSSYSIYDNNGKLIVANTDISGRKTSRNVSLLKPGQYFIRFNQNKEIIQKVFIKN